jgi:hypothetical protein
VEFPSSSSTLYDGYGGYEKLGKGGWGGVAAAQAA